MENTSEEAKQRAKNYMSLKGALEPKTMNKTALQNLIDYMEENYHLTEESRSEFKKALKEEKQQILDAFNQGYREGISDAQIITKNDKDVAEYQDAELYYNQTFNQ